MRSPVSARRRLRSRPPRHRLVDDLARLLDEGCVDETSPVLFHALAPDGEDIDLGIKVLEPDTHPFPALAGFTAPPAWDVFGVRVHGTAHALDDGTTTRTTATFLCTRSGEEASILRRGDTATVVRDRAAGTVPDTCRRVLGLPTDPAPRSTALLWTMLWLDAVLARWSEEPAQRRHLQSFEAVAALHPAVIGRDDADAPAALVRVGREHASRWSWPRLRAEPDAAALPDGPLPVDIAAWMDDGFFARWCLGAFPHPAVLAGDLVDLLGEQVGDELADALSGLLFDDPPG